MEKIQSLNRVMELEIGGIKGDLRSLVVAVHAVFLDSGFAPKGWDVPPTRVISIQYTIPGLPDKIQEQVVKHASLKFQVMKNDVLVYGSLSAGESDVYRLYLNLAEVTPLFEFWKTVKDMLCMPLLMDVCLENGLPPPPSFASLPADLKVKILLLLPGVDVARIECTCSEMRQLASSDELWKKFVEEFGPANKRLQSACFWKDKFEYCWIRRRDAEQSKCELERNREQLERNRERYRINFMSRPNGSWIWMSRAGFYTTLQYGDGLGVDDGFMD